MGNCFGRPDKSDNFKGQGRTLGAPATPASGTPARTPAAQGQSRVLGGNQVDAAPGSAAAQAAEARRLSGQGKGKLGKQLDAQKKMTNNDVLAQVSQENRAARDMDAGAEARAHN